MQILQLLNTISYCILLCAVLNDAFLRQKYPERTANFINCFTVINLVSLHAYFE
jgi:hypothetical protein